jgi:hypothetical protein
MNGSDIKESIKNEKLTAKNFEPSGCKEAPPSSLKFMLPGIVYCLTIDKSSKSRNETYNI